jgi:hypothetical protein
LFYWRSPSMWGPSKLIFHPQTPLSPSFSYFPSSFTFCFKTHFADRPHPHQILLPCSLIALRCFQLVCKCLLRRWVRE